MIVHLNGRLVPLADASISPLDRGFIFGDGVYEGLRAFGGRIVGMDRHVARLRDGLDEARIPFDASSIVGVAESILRANGLADAFIYVHVTRGAPLPGHPIRSRIPAAPLTPTCFAFATPTPPLSAYPPVPEKSAITTRDTRWLRGHLKSISLIGSVIAGIEASEAGAEDAILVREDVAGERWAAESTSANLLVVTAQGQLVTPPMGDVPILGGVTLAILKDACRRVGIEVVESMVPGGALVDAREVILCGTLTMVTSITRLDNRPVGEGRAGPVAGRLLGVLRDAIASGA